MLSVSRTDGGRYGFAVLPAVGVIVVVGYLVALAWAMSHRDYDVWGGLVVAPVLIALTMPLARRAARTEDDPRLRQLIIFALVLKLAAAIVRYVIAFDVYDGVADAATYINTGQRLAESYKEGVFSGLVLGPGGSGTDFMRIVSGIAFTIIGPTEIGAFLVFSWLGFWGLYGFYRAFRIGVPDGDHRRYALLVFFLPSLLFWPSSIGKEAWMMLNLGLASYGVARVLARQRGGYVLLVAGLAGAAAVRPHISALVVAGLGVAYLLRRARRASAFGPFIKLGGLAVIVALLAITLQQAEAFFGVQDAAGGGVEDVLDETVRRTSQGGSQFQATSARSPADVPQAVVAVLFRPFPHEAGNVQALAASLEGVLLMGLFAMSWPRLRGLRKRLRESPYLAYAIVYAVLFCVAFSSIGNFGILTRQRVQLLPLALVVLALPRSAPISAELQRVRN